MLRLIHCSLIALACADVPSDGPFTQEFVVETWDTQEWGCTAAGDFAAQGKAIESEDAESYCDGTVQLTYYRRMPAGGDITKAVVFLHGGGSRASGYNKKDVDWAEGVDFYFLEAPQVRTNKKGDGFTWPAYLYEADTSAQAQACRDLNEEFGRSCDIGEDDTTSCADIRNCRYEDASIQNTAQFVTLFVEWLAGDLGLDLEDVFVGGYSQGAQTAAHLAASGLGVGGFFLDSVNPFQYSINLGQEELDTRLVMFHSRDDSHFPIQNSLNRMHQLFSNFDETEDLMQVGGNEHSDMGSVVAMAALQCFMRELDYDCYADAAELNKLVVTV